METSEVKPAGGMPARVLVVENDGFQAMAAEGALLDAGALEVCCCATAQAAMAALDAGIPDAIVLDSRLDDRDDGWAIAELVQALGGRQPAIVFATGNPEEIPPHVVELGTLLPKPYTAAALIDAVRARAGGRLAARLREALNTLS